MTIHRLSLAVLPLALLAGCGDTGAPEEGRLQGEVLEGTISDAMIPLDQVRSRAPLAQDVAEPGSAGGAAGAASADEGDSAAEVDAQQPTPTPAETPVTVTDEPAE